MAVNIIFFLYSVVTLLLNYRTLDCFFFLINFTHLLGRRFYDCRKMLKNIFMDV